MSTATSQRDERIAEHETLTLSPRDWDAFLVALDDAERPRPRLAAAALRYQSRCQRDAG